MQALRELQQLILNHGEPGTAQTPIPGLQLLRFDRVTRTPTQGVYTPMVCLIAQGEKQVTLAEEIFTYNAAQYLITSVDLPISGIIREATTERPYLALSLALNPALLSSLVLDIARNAPAIVAKPVMTRGLAVTPLPPDLLDAFVRLLRLLRSPAEIPLLAPLILREIVYRLLTGEQAGMLRQIALRESSTQAVVRAINWIRGHYAEPFHMHELVEVTHMSTPSLHRHFKAVTGMTPLGYQKQIRLLEARRLLIAEGQDAAAAGFSVGYDSPSQFSREYSRHFGAPPRQDADRLLAEHVLPS